MQDIKGPSVAVDVGRIALLVTAVWMTIVVIGNVVDAFCTLGVLPKSMPLASGNFAQIQELLAKPSLSTLAAPAFAAAIVIEAFAAACLWTAAWRRAAAVENLAFASLVLLFGGFVIVDELCTNYGLEAVHRGLVAYAGVLYLVVTLTRTPV